MAELKARNFEDLIKRLNPFGIKDEKGETMAFADYGKCYLHTLLKLRQMFPRGFIDMPLFLCSLTGIPLPDARRFAKKLPFVRLDREIYLCPWEDEASNPRYKAELIMRALHSLSETTFSPDFFGWAWEEFNKKPAS